MKSVRLFVIILMLVLIAGWFYGTKITDYLNTKLKMKSVFINRSQEGEQPSTSQQVSQPNTYGSCEGPWVNWYQEFHAQSLASRNSADRNTSRFLVFLCPGHSRGCGGFGNRIYGIVSLFYLAVLTNRVFLINWGGSEKLEHFLEPNKINWTYDESLLQDLKKRRSFWGGFGPFANYDASRIETYPKFLNWIEKEKFNVFFDHGVESIGTYWYFAEQIWKNPYLYKRAKELGIPPEEKEFPFAMLGCAMNFLFKKSPYLEDKLSQARKLLNVRPHPYIGIHLRTSDHHWGDPNPQSFLTNNPERVVECAQRAQSLIQAKNPFYNRSITWLLATDDIKFKETWMKRFPNLFTLKSNPQHLDYSRGKGVICDILVDIFLLEDSDYFIATYHSTFSHTVVGLRGFSTKSFTYGERCSINETSLELASHHH